MSFDEPVATEIDGVQVWYTDVPGPCLAGLVFRTGAADETLRIHGINHIVEHLALFPLMESGLDMNGSVEALTTRFIVNGTQEDAESFLTHVCRNVSSLPLERLDQERNILETEARSGSGSFAGSASARFGTRGFGLVDWFQFGLRHLGPDDVASWAADHFTSGQAAVYMTRPPSPSLRLELPSGSRLPIPVPEPIPGLVMPSHIHGSEFGLGCSFSATRSLALLIATIILRERAMTTMRLERALSYMVVRHEERIGPLDSVYTLALDAIEDRMSEAVGVLDPLLEGVAEEVTPEEVERAHRSAMPWNSTDPARPANEAARKCVASLFGREPTPWKGLEHQGARLTPQKVCTAMREALETTIFVAPEGVEVPHRYARHPTPPRKDEPVWGRLYARWDGSSTDETVMGRTGVMRRFGPNEFGIRFEDVEVAVLGPDGSVTLIGRAGDHISLEPNQLMKGKDLMSLLLESLEGRVVDMHGDLVSWFELQTLVDGHDSEVIKALWREIDVLASMRRRGERILAVAIGDMNGRGIFAVTDRRVLHIAITTQLGLVVWEEERSSIVGVYTTAGLLGSKLRISVRGRGEAQLDRIRPREHAAQLEVLLSPLEDPDGD